MSHECVYCDAQIVRGLCESCAVELQARLADARRQNLLHVDALEIAKDALAVIRDGNHSTTVGEHLYVAVNTAKEALAEIDKVKP